MTSPQRRITAWFVGVGLIGFAVSSCPALAQAPAVPLPVIPGQPPSRVIASLVDSANYWRAHGETRFALRELDRVLTFAPNNPDVLAAAAEVAFELNDYDAAAKYRARLKQAAPGDPRNQTLAAERQLTPEQIATVNDARSLAQSGKKAESVAKYQALFQNGVVPTNLAIEYYTVLGSMDEGFEEASTKLGALADQSPKDARLQLAYAKVLVLHEATRSDGIKRLADLANNPDVEQAARQAWRETLLWQGASERSRAQLVTYLQSNPADGAIEAKKREFDALLPDEGAKAMLRGYNLMGSDVNAAEQEFKAALAFNPNNPDAMVMMAAIWRTQGRAAEAQVLINRALALAPDRRDELIKSAGGNEYASQVPLGMTEQAEIARLTVTGHYDDAQQLLSQLITGKEKPVTLIQLGDLQRRAGHLADAEATFRSALTMAPGNPDATCGLASTQALAGHYDDAAALYAQAGAVYARTKNQLGRRRVAIGEAGLAKLRTGPQSATLAGPGQPAATASAVQQVSQRR